MNLAIMEGECIRLENVAPGSRAMFHGIRAHIYSYRLFYGEIPKDMWVLHTCDNSWCVHPEHLYLGTRQDNELDKVRRERSAHMKLTREQVQEIRDIYDHPDRYWGMQTDLARKYGVDTGTISRIVNRKYRFYDELGDY